MITDIEKQFFDTFGIEPRQWYKISMGKKGNFYNEPTHKRYPQITDTHYLQLLCLFTKEMNCFTVYDEDVNALKEAKNSHDRLEAVYNPYVDFDGVRAMAALEAGRLLSYWKTVKNEG